MLNGKVLGKIKVSIHVSLRMLPHPMRWIYNPTKALQDMIIQSVMVHVIKIVAYKKN